jgi:hypothetical protein
MKKIPRSNHIIWGQYLFHPPYSEERNTKTATVTQTPTPTPKPAPIATPMPMLATAAPTPAPSITPTNMLNGKAATPQPWLIARIGAGPGKGKNRSYDASYFFDRSPAKAIFVIEGRALGCSVWLG